MGKVCPRTWVWQAESEQHKLHGPSQEERGKSRDALSPETPVPPHLLSWLLSTRKAGFIILIALFSQIHVHSQLYFIYRSSKTVFTFLRVRRPLTFTLGPVKWLSGFDFRSSHGGRRELNPANYPLTSMSILSRALSACMHSRIALEHSCKWVNVFLCLFCLERVRKGMLRFSILTKVAALYCVCQVLEDCPQIGISCWSFQRNI